MNKLVILGAGFSAPAGIPAMRGFFNRLQELINNSPYAGLCPGVSARKVANAEWRALR